MSSNLTGDFRNFRTILFGATVSESLLYITGLPEKLVARGWDVHVVSSSGPELARLGQIPGVSTHVLKMSRRFTPIADVGALMKWIALCRRVRPTIVSLGTPKASLFGLIAARLTRVPHRLYMLYGLRLESAVGVARAMLSQLESLAMSNATHVFAVSFSLRRKVLELRLSNPRRLSVLGAGSANGVNLEQYDADRHSKAEIEDLRQSIGLFPNKQTIGFVGRITRDKGLFDLADAAALLLQKGVPIQILVVGREDDASGKAALQKLRSTGVPLITTGFIEDPSAMYQLMDVMCLPSHREGFPTVVLEASSSSVPVVVSTATGAVDSVLDGVTGVLFKTGDVKDLANKLQSVLTSRSRSAVMRKSGRAWVATYFADTKVHAESIDLYERLLEEEHGLATRGQASSGVNRETVERTYYHATEARLHRGLDGRVRSASPNDWYESFAPWLVSFNRIVVVARVAPGASNEGQLVEGPRVAVLAVPYYRGVAELALRWYSVRRVIMRSCKDSSAFYGGRLPGVIASHLLAASKKVRAPFLASVVGDPEAVLRSGAIGRFGTTLAPAAAAVMRWQVRAASAVLFVSERYLQSKYPARPGVPTFTRSTVDLSGDALVTHPVHVRGYSKKLIIIAVGSQDRTYKGHDLLIRAIPLIREAGIDVEVQLAGAGRTQRSLRSLAASLMVEDSVCFLGHVEQPEELRRLLDTAQLFVMPSRTEGVPRALIEAMARAKPCLGSDVGGIPELLDRTAIFPSDDLQAMVHLVLTKGVDKDWLNEQSQRNLAKAREIVATNDGNDFHVFLAAFSTKVAR